VLFTGNASLVDDNVFSAIAVLVRKELTSADVEMWNCLAIDDKPDKPDNATSSKFFVSVLSAL